MVVSHPLLLPFPLPSMGISSLWCYASFKVQFKCHISQLILSVAHPYPEGTFFYVCQLDFQLPVAVTSWELSVATESVLSMCSAGSKPLSQDSAALTNNQQDCFLG